MATLARGLGYVFVESEESRQDDGGCLRALSVRFAESVEWMRNVMKGKSWVAICGW